MKTKEIKTDQQLPPTKKAKIIREKGKRNLTILLRGIADTQEDNANGVIGRYKVLQYKNILGKEFFEIVGHLTQYDNNNYSLSWLETEFRDYQQINNIEEKNVVIENLK